MAQVPPPRGRVLPMRGALGSLSLRYERRWEILAQGLYLSLGKSSQMPNTSQTRREECK